MAHTLLKVFKPKNSIGCWYAISTFENYKNKSMRIFITALLFITSVSGGCQNNKPNVKNEGLNELDKKYNLDKIKVPAGFKVNVFAEVSNARSMCWGDKGTLFVGNSREDNVYAVVDENKDGVADKVYTIASDLNMPNGVAFKNGSLYVSALDKIFRYDNIEDNLSNPPIPVLITDKYPNKTHHGWKYIAFGPDGKLYVPVGAPCNVCNEKDSIFSTITTY